ncbi:TonB-linked SusC/RagA family outer membrane protein [Catalinimonas alkaloidigena]|uniref:SusC/RagA family TonB-linked outer membrane protein n=1 Tax=Catalinimonas alkaloidigena TaxID=1075417 RepID=UPI002405FDC6|nr:SusC/RagA family TonB-linked outer membrane protein [Catalinimonas alkaloidigena]MDF9798547.1 TonB-linked SusC/RagA family outer membrane protein [Catalinimonas alkaloidigena]
MMNLLQTLVRVRYKAGFSSGLLLFSLLLGFTAYAQEMSISGKVTDPNNEPIPGVNVLVKGTTQGTITDIEGNYRLNVAENAETLVFSFVGYETQEVTINGRTTIDVNLGLDARELGEVVVTALGVERETKALGYSVQEIQGESITQARETNLVNSLAGKVAGVNVTGSSTTIGGSSRITIRGESSLDINKNQPLFIVDGVPINNNMIGSSGSGNLEADYGNGAGEVNPDDVESISVLKGPNAAALYGSRAANGVIIITTKSGKGANGIGVSVNSTTSFENPLRLPDWQDQYGQGNRGQFAFVDGSGAGIADGVDESWGPRLDGQLLPQFDSPRDAAGFRGGDIDAAPDGSTITPTPWTANPDNINDFFETGVTLTNNVAVSGGNKDGNFRLSFTNLDQSGMLPNTDLRRNTMLFSGGYNLTDKLKANAMVNYIRSRSDNRPSISYGTESIMYLWVWYGRQINTGNLRDYWQPGLEGRQQFNYNYNYHDNPYFTMYENTNGQAKDRVLGNISLTYKFTDELSLMVRSGTDFYRELRDRKRAFSTQRFPFGMYREDNIFFEERNTDFLLTYDKNFDDVWDVNVSLGGNRMDQNYEYNELVAPQLSIPGIYNFGNSRVALQAEEFVNSKRINSLYGLARFGYQNVLFLDLTARNDWSSTLPADNNSYFYPSVSASAVISDMVELPSAISFAKLRAGWAQVGNDTDPYRLTNVYNYLPPWETTQRVTESSVIRNPELKPEIVTSFEIGTDMRFFGGRMGLDFTYYNMSSRNQILQIDVDRTSGYSSKVINAGEIENRGVELMLTGTPVELNNSLRWDVSVNWSRNRSQVVELADDIPSYRIAANRGAEILAVPGERMGDIYGSVFQRYNGEIVYNESGFPLRTSELEKVGNYNPDWMMGINNTISFKGFNLGVLLDIRQGGIIVSQTTWIGRNAGQLEGTVVGRENGMVGEGVIATAYDEAGNITAARPNDVVVPARDWNYQYFRRESNIEAGAWDASYTKLREIRFGYTLPNSLLESLPFRDVSLSVVGRNVALWTQNPHIDPENMSLSGGTLVPGVENMAYPTPRSIGFNLNFKL